MKKLLLDLILIIFCSSVFSQNPKDVFELARTGSDNEVLEVLKLNSNAFNVFNGDGYSPLILACYRGNNKTAFILIANTDDIDYRSSMGTALMAASIKGNLEIVNELLRKNANPDICDSNGTTALIYAAMFLKKDIAQALVNAKVNREAKDNRGNTALDYAILANNDELIKILKS